jgi:hypothetical protein
VAIPTESVTVSDQATTQPPADSRPSWLLWATIAIPPVLYLVFVYHFAVDSFFGDDWSLAPLAHSAIAGNLSFGQLWAQYNESRLFVGAVVVSAFAWGDHLDLRSLLIFSALVLTGSYGLLLLLVRKYLERPLGPLLVLVVGALWFSLADVQNVLWAFQVSWYLTLFWFVAMLCALLLPAQRTWLWLGLGIGVAAVGSFTTLQGFLLWPVGLVALMWMRRNAAEIGIWCAGALVTALAYFPGYNSGMNGCWGTSICTPGNSLAHPWTTTRFFFILIGNVIPGGAAVINPVSVHSVLRFELLGLVAFAVAVGILIQSWRGRDTEVVPLPFLLIAFALLFDLTVVLGRGDTGLSSAVNDNRYVMANLVLLTGMALYAWVHLPRTKAFAGRRMAAIAIIVVLVGIQCVASTEFGLVNGRADHATLTSYARFFVNQSHISSARQACEMEAVKYLQLGAFVRPFAVSLHAARADGLGEFGEARYFRSLNSPELSSYCLPKPR